MLLFSATSLSAANSVDIEQLGSGSIEINQSGANNAIQVHQSDKDAPPFPNDNQKNPNPPLGYPPSGNATSDYQKSILANPYTSAPARAQALTDQKDATQQNVAKKVNAPEIKKSGKINLTGNKASISQEGNSNDILIKQTGQNNNEVARKQTGNYNHSRVIQNDKVIEDTTK